MAVPFDHIAHFYDLSFTNTVIGQLQRKRVWRYLEEIIPELDGLEILELNCGTGEDAVLFGDRGFNIVATDISEEMLKVTQQKVRQYSLQNKISSHYLDLDSFDETIFNKKFDLIFSNFGSINCISPEALQKLLKKIPSILEPGGRFVAVIMPRYCLWETIFFLFKFQFRKAFRRWTSKDVQAHPEGIVQKTWYYQPRKIKKWAKVYFEVVDTIPIGVFVPPNFMEKFFSTRNRSLFGLYFLEKRIGYNSWLSGFSDHFVIDFKVK
jgi:ubiquinone/menaquinone biosynthesis C-methylase UbiE